MSFEDEFDKIIRQKAEEAGYEFDQANWEKASKMLNAERAAMATAGLKRLYIPALALGIAGLTVLAALYPVVNEPAPQQTIAQSANQLNHSSDISSKENSKPFSDNAVASQATDHHTANADNPVAGKVSANNSSETTIDTKNSITTDEKVVSPRFKTETIYRVVDVVTTADKLSTNTTEKVVATQETLANNAGVSTPKAQTADSASDITAESVVEQTQLNTDLNLNPEAKISLKTAATDQLKNPVEAMMPAAIKNTETQSQMMVEQLSLIPVDFMLQEPLLKPINNNDYFDIHFRKHAVNAEAGAYYNTGWQTPAGIDGNGFNWYAALNYIYSPNRKIGFGSGIQFYNVANISQPFHTATKTEYGFGSVSSGTVLTGQELYYWAVPFKIYYSPAINHQFGLGFTTSYLYNATSISETYVVMDGIKKYGAKQNVKGVYNGTSVYNFALNASYSLKLSKRTAFNTEFVYTLSDIYANTTSVKNSEKPVGVRLGLRYTLIEK